MGNAPLSVCVVIMEQDLNLKHLKKMNGECLIFINKFCQLINSQLNLYLPYTDVHETLYTWCFPSVQDWRSIKCFLTLTHSWFGPVPSWVSFLLYWLLFIYSCLVNNKIKQICWGQNVRPLTTCTYFCLSFLKWSFLNKWSFLIPSF